MIYENKPQTEKALAKDEIKNGTHIVSFCEFCEDVVDAKVIESVSKIYDMGKVAHFNRLELFCTRCGRTIQEDMIDEINDERQSIIE